MALVLPHTLVPGTNENVSEVQNNFNEIANTFPVQAANIGDAQITAPKLASAAVTPRKAATIAHVSAVASYTFSSLNGDTQYGYELIVQGRMFNGGVARSIEVRPNNDSAANYHSTQHTANSAGGHAVNTVGPTGWRLAFGTYTTDTTINAFAIINAKTATSVNRTMASKVINHEVAGGGAYSNDEIYSRWTNTASNITSLVVDFGAVTFTGFLSLRVLAEA